MRQKNRAKVATLSFAAIVALSSQGVQADSLEKNNGKEIDDPQNTQPIVVEDIVLPDPMVIDLERVPNLTNNGGVVSLTEWAHGTR